MNIDRREFLIAATLAPLALAGCSNSGSEEVTDVYEWVAEQDDSLNCLTIEVSGGAIVAMPGDGWAMRDGYVQLQLSGGSIPGQEIQEVYNEGSTLTVKLKETDEPSTLNLILSEYRLTPKNRGVIPEIENVKVDYGHGDVQEIQKAYE